MIPPKEKAEELVDKFKNTHSNKLSDYSKIEYPTAKQCALVCVEEILSEYAVLQIETNFCFKMWKYWNEVKEEIENP